LDFLEGREEVSIPNGYFEVSLNGVGAAAHCRHDAPAFVRGRLVTQADWSKLTNPNGLFTKYPRWILYGGPLQTRDLAEQYIYTMYFWAQQQNLVWMPDPVKPTPCIVSPNEIQWPVEKPINWGNIFRWVWVRETEVPLTLFKHTDSKWRNQPKGTL
jgi:hypothetical protein